MGCRTWSFPVHHQLPELAQTNAHQVSDAIHHLILCRPLLLLPSIFSSIRVFPNESALCIRWPKHWSFSFSMSTSNEYSGLISFRIDWLDLFAVQRPLKSLLQRPQFKSINSLVLSFLYSPALTSIESVMPSTISSSVVPFSSCPQSLPASESFPVSQLFA